MIEKLFSSKILFQILTVLFQEKGKHLITSEIIKKTDKKQPNVMRELEKLSDWGIVIKQKRGNQNFYKLNKNNISYPALKAMFIAYLNQNRYYLANEESGPAFLSLHYLMNGFTNKKITETGIINHIPNIASYFKDDYVWFYFEKEKFQKNAQESLKKLLKDTGFVKKTIYKESIKNGEKAIKIFRQLKNKNYRTTKKQTKELIRQFEDITANLIAYNYIAILDLRDFVFSEYLKKYLAKKSKNSEYKINYLIEKFLAPELLTDTQLLRIDLLKTTLLKNSSSRKQRLNKIWSDWCWINYGYRGPELPFKYFENIVDELLKTEPQKIKKELNDLANHRMIVRRQKNKLYRELKIDKQHRDFINALSLLSYLKIYRKDITFLLIFLTYKIIDNFNKTLSRKNLLYLTIDEAIDLIDGKFKTPKRLLDERERQSLYLSKGKKILYGQEAENFVAENVEEDEIKNTQNEIKLLEGTTACLGKNGDWIYGEVKIVNRAEDMKKMGEGEVLVSVATTPELLPAMKKAGAIVTDHGGITSHAAIVSRELNIPCLIGTRYATKVFKDGDKVIVCPRHGYIRFQ